MQIKLVVKLYRALLECVQHSKHLYPSVTAIQIREPVVGELGSFTPTAPTSDEAHLLEAIEAVVPGLEVPPSAAELSWEDIRKLIRANFEANKRVNPSQVQELTDQAFTALRAVPDQAYLEACSSTTVTEGVRVEATSCYSARDAAFLIGTTPPRTFFRYRIRIINQRQHPIKVLGRQWVIQHDSGRLEAMVQLSPDNGIVGQQPVIPPNSCFQYVSGSNLTNSPNSQEVPSGSMVGTLLVDLYDADSSTAPERVQVPVGSFKLRRRVI